MGHRTVGTLSGRTHVRSKGHFQSKKDLVSRTGRHDPRGGRQPTQRAIRGRMVRHVGTRCDPKRLESALQESTLAPKGQRFRSTAVSDMGAAPPSRSREPRSAVTKLKDSASAARARRSRLCGDLSAQG